MKRDTCWHPDTCWHLESWGPASTWDHISVPFSLSLGVPQASPYLQTINPEIAAADQTMKNSEDGSEMT